MIYDFSRTAITLSHLRKRLIAFFIFSIFFIITASAIPHASASPPNDKEPLTINSLPPEIILHIIMYMDLKSACSFRHTSQHSLKIIPPLIDLLWMKEPILASGCNNRQSSCYIDFSKIAPPAIDDTVLEMAFNKIPDSLLSAKKLFENNQESSDNLSSAAQAKKKFFIARILSRKGYLSPCFQYTLFNNDHASILSCIIQLDDDRLVSAYSCNGDLDVWDLSKPQGYEFVTRLKTRSRYTKSMLKLADCRLVSIHYESLDEPRYNRQQEKRSLLRVFDLKMLENSLDNNKDCCIAILDPCVISSSDNNKCNVSVIQLKDGRLVSTSPDLCLKIWDLKQLESKENCCVATLGEDEIFFAVTQLSDERLISSSASCSDSRNILKIWNLKQLNNNHACCVAKLEGHEENVNQIIQLTDGLLISSAIADTIIKVWDLDQPENQQPIATLKEDKCSFNTITQLPDGKLAALTCCGTLKIWDLSKPGGNCSVTISTKCKPKFFTPLADGRLAFISEDYHLKIWDLDQAMFDQAVKKTAIKSCYASSSCIKTSHSAQSLIQLNDGRLMVVYDFFSFFTSIWDLYHYSKKTPCSCSCSCSHFGPSSSSGFCACAPYSIKSD